MRVRLRRPVFISPPSLSLSLAAQRPRPTGGVMPPCDGRLYPQRAERPIGGGPMSERPRCDHARGGGSPDREQRWDGRGPRSGQPSTAAVKAGTLELVVLPSERRSDCAAVKSPN